VLLEGLYQRKIPSGIESVTFLVVEQCLYQLFHHVSGFCGLAVSMLASGTQDRGLKPGRSFQIFEQKNPQHAFLRRGSKAVCPMSQICGM
jgi:hypothetical protein